MTKKEDINNIHFEGAIWHAYLRTKDALVKEGIINGLDTPNLFILPPEEELFVKHLVNCLKKYPCNDIAITEEQFNVKKEKYPNNTEDEIKFYIKYLRVMDEIMYESYKYTFENFGVKTINLDMLLLGLSALTKHNIPYEEINNISSGIIIGSKILSNKEIDKDIEKGYISSKPNANARRN